MVPGTGRSGQELSIDACAEDRKLPDYPALRQVQNALWKIGEVHGAAVMVGAGFSQFADRAAETTPLAPLWPDHIRNLTELLSRFGMLFQETAALDLSRFGTSLAHDPNVKHWFHFESLQNLLRRSREQTDEWSLRIASL